MKNSLIILFFFITVTLNATTYYVSTSGSDSNPGTLAQPWATWQKGFNSVSPGDILYIRGGTYSPGGSVIAGVFAAVGANGKNGTSGSQYQVYAYPGETPVLDCSNLTNNSYERIGILITNSSYWHVMGLEIKNCNQVSSSSPHYGGQGVSVTGSSNILIENCVAHNNQGPGMGTRDVNEVTFLNCDAHDNYDPYSDIPGDNADGFDIGFQKSDNIVRCTGCRSWNNSDDGFDMYQDSGYSGIYYLTNCWSWHMGYKSDQTTEGGDGNGYKYGLDAQSYSGTTKRYTDNCVAFDNRTVGFSQQSANVKMVFYNNIAYSNGIQGYEFNYYNCADILKNNVSYSNGSTDVFQSNQARTNNSWQNSLAVSNSDFSSVDGSQLALPRKADGSLPDISFLHPASGSHLIDAGIDVGLPFSGNAPDLGPFESQSGSSATIPVFSSAAVENATPALLEMTYNTALANVVPASSAFTVKVNSVARTINTVAVSGVKVQLTLASPVVYGDVVTIAYTKPSANPVQTSAGGQAVSISAQTVTNKVVSAIPGYVSSVVQNATPSLLEMTYSMTLANIVPASSAFSVQVNATARTISKVAISESKVQLTLSSPIKYGDIVTVLYTKLATNPIQTATGGFAATISAQPVTNNLINPTKDASAITVKMTITPSHIHKVCNVTLAYTGSLTTQAASITPEIVRITDLSGKLMLELLLDTGVTSVKIPVNLRRGVYYVVLAGGGTQLASQKIMVY